MFFARCINRLWFRYLPLLSHSLRPHICDGWAGLFASQFIHTRGEWVCTCSVVPHMCVQFLLSIYLFIRKRIIINRSRVKSIKCAISWWPHTILPTRKFATLINLFTRWMSSDIVGCVHVDVVVVIVIAMCGDVKLLGWQAQQKQRQKQKNN